eukprot:gene14940-6085_t
MDTKHIEKIIERLLAPIHSKLDALPTKSDIESSMQIFREKVVLVEEKVERSETLKIHDVPRSTLVVLLPTKQFTDLITNKKIAFKALDPLGEPVTCSSPVSLANSHKTDLSTTPMGPLKVLTTNVNHFLAKHLELKRFIIDNDIDIVIACATKIDNSVQDAELGLSDFDVYRQDRDLNGGGMLVAVKKTLKSVRLDISTTCELVVVKLLTENTIPAIIGAFYLSSLIKSMHSGAQELLTKDTKSS